MTFKTKSKKKKITQGLGLKPMLPCLDRGELVADYVNEKVSDIADDLYGELVS